MRTDKPNVLIVVVDQLRRDGLGCYGDPVTLTPHLDRFACEGVRCTDCVSQHPVCSPWRASLQTGHYAHVHGVAHNNQPIDTGLESLADCFNRAGYHTAYAGKCHWWNSGKPGRIPEVARLRYQEWQGFNCGHYHFDTPDFDEAGNLTHRHAGRYEPDVQTDWAIDFLRRQRETPWMLQLNLGPPHNATMDADYADPVNRERMKRVNARRGFGISEEIMDADRATDPPVTGNFPQHLAGRLLPEAYLGLYAEGDFPDRPDIPQSERTLAAAMRKEYSAMTTSIDDQMGRLLTELEATGAAENTLVVFTSDHGDHLGAHGRRRGKSSSLQAAWRTPLIVRGPGCGSGKISDALISGIDLFPTLCGLAGVEAGGTDRPGRDLSSCLAGSVESQEAVLVGLRNWRCLVTREWAYTVEKKDGTLAPVRLIRRSEDLYDLNDLKDADPDTARNCHEMLIQKLHESGDPLGPTTQ